MATTEESTAQVYPWKQLGDEKGFLLVDAGTGTIIVAYLIDDASGVFIDQATVYSADDFFMLEIGRFTVRITPTGAAVYAFNRGNLA